ncbi:uncharacterized protein [Mobula birostris]|uniref:uncharacterized protein n=1 Tax=Mobula birostris TaxID=1983395 RepID=UPI003B28AD3C
MIEKAQELYGSPGSLDMPTQAQIKPERLDHVDSAKKSSTVQIQETCSSLIKEEVPIPDSNLPYYEELTEILLSYPLLKILEEIKQTLINHQHELQTESSNNLPDITPLSDHSLIPADLGNLSPHHFVIYRFGCSITHLLYSSCDYAPLTLLMADDVPNEQDIHCKNRSYTNGFYYDADNRILYIRSAWLNNVGQLIVLILHVMAHVKAGIQINDDHPTFTEEFDHAVAILATTLFEMFFDTTSSVAEVHQDAEILDSKNGGKNKLVPSTQSIFEDLIHIKVPPETKFMEEILNERLKKYTVFNLHNVLQQILKSTDTDKGFSVQKARQMTELTLGIGTETVESYNEDLLESNTQISILKLENEVDKMNEEFSLCTTKISEYNQQIEYLEKELRIQDNFMQEHDRSLEMPPDDFSNLLRELAQARRKVSILHLQRHCVMNKLSELEPRLTDLYTTLETNPSSTSAMRTKLYSEHDRKVKEDECVKHVV